MSCNAVAAGTAVADAVCFARDLVNTPGGTLTPAVFADRAAERAAKEEAQKAQEPKASQE